MDRVSQIVTSHKKAYIQATVILWSLFCKRAGNVRGLGCPTNSTTILLPVTAQLTSSSDAAITVVESQSPSRNRGVRYGHWARSTFTPWNEVSTGLHTKPLSTNV